MLVGIDAGTSALKAIAIEPDGRVALSAERPLELLTPEPRWAEQDGEAFVRAAEGALGELAGRLGTRAREVRGIGLTGQMHTAILLGERRELVRRAMLWCDTRTSEECRAITEALGLDGLRRTVKNRALEGFTLPKLLWLRNHEPDVFARVRTVVMPKDWVGFRLTGELATDASDASGTLAFDPAARAWSREILEALSIDPAIFPPFAESPVLLGEVRAGPFAGVPVVRGGADNAAAAVGLGVVREGRAMASLGTSGVVLAHTGALRTDPEMRLHAFCASVPGESYVMGVMLAAGGALRWYRDTVARRPYDEITALAATAPPGAGGVVFLPYLMGERTPHDDAFARAAFVGMTARTTEAHLARAVLEGVAFGLGDSLALVRETGVRVGELRLAGGGAKSAVWRRILADVFDADVVMTTSTEGPSFGAAVLAGAGTGVLPSVADGAEALVRVVDRTRPDPVAVATYRELHGTYRALYGDLRERFRRLGGVTPR